MATADEFLTSNLLNASMLTPNTKIEATIISVRKRDFEDGSKKLVVYTDYMGLGIVLNQTRLKEMIRAFGVNYETQWVGKKLIISQGDTAYQGRPEKRVVIEPIVATRIGTAPKPRLATVNDGRGAASRGPIDARAGKGVWGGEAPPETPPFDPDYDYYRGEPPDVDDPGSSSS
jgi:hypothetical protein